MRVSIERESEHQGGKQMDRLPPGIYQSVTSGGIFVKMSQAHGFFVGKKTMLRYMNPSNLGEWYAPFTGTITLSND